MVDVAWATNGAAPAPQGGFMGFLPLILIFVVFYFLLIRPQQKKARLHQEFVQNLKKGDEVVTNGGIYGKITGLTDRVATLEIADNVRIKISRQYILGSAADTDAECADKKGGAACSLDSKG